MTRQEALQEELSNVELQLHAYDGDSGEIRQTLRDKIAELHHKIKETEEDRND